MGNLREFRIYLDVNILISHNFYEFSKTKIFKKFYDSLIYVVLINYFKELIEYIY